MHSWNIAPERIRVQAMGETAPLADNATPQGRASNRRVTLEVLAAPERLAQGFPPESEPPALLREQLHYASGERTARTMEAESLQRIAAFLDEHPDAVVLIQGHTDGRGNGTNNMLLSQERANDVMMALHEAHGVPMERMRVMAHGENAPMADNNDAAGRRLNRRVDITCGPADIIAWDAALLL